VISNLLRQLMDAPSSAEYHLGPRRNRPAQQSARSSEENVWVVHGTHARGTLAEPALQSRVAA